MRRHYSGASLFKWLRTKFKIEKPSALGWGEWDKWDKETKKNHLVGYFFTETLPDIIEWFPNTFIDPINDFRYYFVNRFIDKSHYLRTGLPPGKYNEFSDRLLYGCFNSYVDFIEIETAHHHLAWADDKTRAEFNQPVWARKWYLRWKKWRCPEAGVAHLQWEMTLDDPSVNQNHLAPEQAANAREKLLLYNWWKHVRAARKNSWVETGFQEFWDEMETKYGTDFLGLDGTRVMTQKEEQKYRKLSKAADDLDQHRDDEDTQMLIRLITKRKHLWT